MAAEWDRADGQASDGGDVQMTRKKLSSAAFALAACCSGALMSASAAQAAGFSAEYVFGDSLSDVGNVYLATGGIEPASPYVNGQFSNGPVWVQDLAARLGLPALIPSLAEGSDYAFGGATTGSTYTNNPAVPNLAQQVDTFLLGNASAPSDALYTFSIGANDLFAILNGSTGGLTPTQAAAAAALVVASEAGELAAAGAKDLALFDVPDLGVTPEITALGPAASAAATALSAFFDQQVLQDLAPIEAAGLTVLDLNTYALIDEAVQDPSTFGFSNVTDPCWTGGFTGSATGGSLCSTLPAVQDTYLFWDDVHPTAAGQLLVSDAALRALGLPVPEPSTWALLLIGFGGLGFAGYRARARATA
jgi:phospholipase/lecithinase/hemolysin